MCSIVRNIHNKFNRLGVLFKHFLYFSSGGYRTATKSTKNHRIRSPTTRRGRTTLYRPKRKSSCCSGCGRHFFPSLGTVSKKIHLALGNDTPLITLSVLSDFWRRVGVGVRVRRCVCTRPVWLCAVFAIKFINKTLFFLQYNSQTQTNSLVFVLLVL